MVSAADNATVAGPAEGAASSDASSTGTEVPTGAPQSPGVLEGLTSLFAAARQTLSDFLELLAMEVRHAGLSLMWMIAWGAVATIFVVTAWVGVMTALALWLVALDVPLIPVVLGIAFANLLAAAVIMSACIRISRNLLFMVTRRQLAAKLRN